MNSTAKIIQQPDIEDPQALVTAFEQFSRLSEQLQQSYRDMDRHAAELSEQLAAANSERLRQLAEESANTPK